ncbi:hypothetical protein AVEN_123341-1 [Araneus ventricosus]|uniref:Uncharacterized protein n=1 Tax=Araneus ventricosus TaxID=182803 RepID=A0A4Y2NG57_ARAVE|nr:hypothetical protein AVEN_123341-1 [Araneus ventricosus]
MFPEAYLFLLTIRVIKQDSDSSVIHTGRLKIKRTTPEPTRRPDTSIPHHREELSPSRNITYARIHKESSVEYCLEILPRFYLVPQN